MHHTKRKRSAAKTSDEGIGMMAAKKRRVEGDAGKSSFEAPSFWAVPYWSPSFWIPKDQHSDTDPIPNSKIKLSVWEKLQVGIAIGLSREKRREDAIYSSFVETISHPGFGSYKRSHPKPFETLSDAQKAIDDQFRFTYYEDPPASDEGDELHAASQRLQAVTGARNSRRFVPFWDDLKCSYNGLKAEEPRAVGDDFRLTDVRRQLELACRANGYRKLEVESLTFKRNGCDLFKDMFQLSPSGQTWEQVKFGDLAIDDEIGTITLYEANVTSSSGATRTWTWFKIEKPLVAGDGRFPSEIRNLPNSWVIIAMPKRQIMQLSADYLNSTKQLTMSLQLTKDGVPSMICSDAPKVVASNLTGPKNFLWVSKMPGARRGRRQRWWKQFQNLATLNARSWEAVQANMERFECLVEVVSKPGADFVHVGPEKKRPGKS
ncbi:unnamed protein product [Clonostachys rosea]|uniref:Uncharacterized protein n=1 Tax=Bionectria ochroleuca TaxID=29856 RepID=A0ABY6V3E3_BIOOC|nr:unnamed protein product [Clonostachys rosea]